MVRQTVSTYARLNKTQFKIVDTLCFLSKNLYNVGLYKSITGQLINADVNSSINHIRNVAGDSPVKEIISRGLFNRPVRIRLAYEQTNFSKQQRIVLPVTQVTLSCNPLSLGRGY
jgi:hypothetical protein